MSVLDELERIRARADAGIAPRVAPPSLPSSLRPEARSGVPPVAPEPGPGPARVPLYGRWPYGAHIIVGALAAAPGPLTAREIAERAGYAPGGGPVGCYLPRLVALGLVERRGRGRARGDPFRHALAGDGVPDLGPLPPAGRPAAAAVPRDLVPGLRGRQVVRSKPVGQYRAASGRTWRKGRRRLAGLSRRGGGS